MCGSTVGDNPFANGVLRLESVPDYQSYGSPATHVFLDPDGSAGPAAEILYITVLAPTPIVQSDFIL